MWFRELMGFDELSHENVQKNIMVSGKQLISKVNGKTYQFGELEVATLEQLKSKTSFRESKRITVREEIGNVQHLHMDATNRNALFQAASQFNLLEMVSPRITPERGVDIYESDFTQGPACAIACGAGTIYRNYFANVNGQIGQTSENQIDCLDLIGRELANGRKHLWEMKNGYALATQDGLQKIYQHINNLNSADRERLKGKLKIGLQWDTEVTLNQTKHKVSQAYCSALPIAYSRIDASFWEVFARLILEATYEATFHAAVINHQRYGANKVFVTLVGGGAFGNKMSWIIDALERILFQFRNSGLDVRIVSYGQSKSEVRQLVQRF